MISKRKRNAFLLLRNMKLVSRKKEKNKREIIGIKNRI